MMIGVCSLKRVQRTRKRTVLLIGFFCTPLVWIPLVIRLLSEDARSNWRPIPNSWTEKDRGVEDKNFTVVISTFRRDTCLKQVMVHWLSCGVREVRIVWNDVERPLPDFVLDEVERAQGKLVVDRPLENRLSNRFLPRNFVTDAVFSVDDDLIYPCAYVIGAYKVWKENPQKLVGFAPRLLRQSASYNWDDSYKWLGWNFANTVFITKGGFSHQRMFSSFFDPRYEDLRQRVDANVTGEDIMFAFVYATTATVENKGPGAVLLTRHDLADTSCVDDNGKKGLSADNKARSKRLSLQLHAESRFGFPFRTIDFREWHFIDAKDEISSVQTDCGQYFGGLNVLWWKCVNNLKHHENI